MKKLFSVCALLALLSCGLIASATAQENADPGDQQRLLYLSMLLKDNPAISLLAARSISQAHGGDVELSDYVAERLIQQAGPKPDKRFLSAINWYIVVLGNTANSRYVDVLTLARERYELPQVLERIDAALVKVGAKVGNQYVPGSLNLEGKRQELNRWVQGQSKAARKEFSSVHAGQGLATVVTQLGVPDDMSTMTIRMSYARGTKLVAHYSGQGALVLTLRGGASEMWSVIEPIDESFPIAEVYRGDNFGVAQMIGNLRGGSFRDYLKFQGSIIKRDPALAVVLAKRLETFSFPADKLEDDANGIAIGMIARHATTNADLFESLKRIAANGGGKKTKAYARKYITWIERRQALPVEPKETEDAVEDGDAR